MKTMLCVSLLLAATAAAVGVAHAYNPCPDEATHSYGYVVSNGRERHIVAEAPLLRVGSLNVDLGYQEVLVADSNASQDCNGDGVPADFDGDYDTGDHGAFFGHGQWANDVLCDYRLNVHGANVVLHDLVFGSLVAFVVAEDDQTGPTYIRDPALGDDYYCVTDGLIAPSVDWDDCVSPTYLGSGQTCGSGGGDGGYWVIILHGGEEGATGVTVFNPHTVGTVTAY